MKCIFSSEQLYNKIGNLKISHWIIFLSIITIIGVIINTISPYPWFYGIVAVMGAISTISIFSEQYFINNFQEILEMISSFNNNVSSLIKWCRNFEKSKFIFYFSSFIILYFGIIGLLLLNNYPSVVSLIYILIFFIITVFISMIGYIQYIILALFMIKLIKIPKPQKRFSAQIPSQVDWIVKINKLVNIYNISFFLLSTLYVISVYFFCFSPQFGVMANGFTLFVKIILGLCWGLISLAIGLILPTVYTTEYVLLKKYIKQVKDKRIELIYADLKKETKNKYSIESVLMMIKLSPDKLSGSYITCIVSFLIWLISALGSVQTFYNILSTTII